MLLNRLSDYQIIRISATLFLLVSIFSATFAQEVPRFYGEEVVVTATRIPQLASKSPWNTSIITSQELKNFRTVGEAVRNVGGVDVISYGYLGAVNSARVRGFNASQVLILVDGRRINSPTLGMFDLGDILTSNVEKVEIVRAPLSAVYGSDAVSGVINIITKIPKPERFFSASVGSFGTNQYKLGIGGDNFLISANYLKSEGFRKNSDCLAKNFYGKISFLFALGELFADYGYYDAAKGVPGVPTSEEEPTSASTPNDRQMDKNTLLSLSFKNDSFILRGYQNTYDQKMDPYIYGTNINKAFRTGIEGQQNLSLGLGNFLYGFEASEDKGETTVSGLHTARNYAAFLQNDLQLSEKMFLSATVRADKHSTAGYSFTPRAGVVYNLARNLNLKLSAGSAFRAPTLNELYWNDPAWGMFGNQSLKPEKAFSYEIGLERSISERLSAKVSYFNSLINDMILWNYDAATLQTNAINIGEVRSEGVEFELDQKLGEGRGYVNYTYQKAIDNKIAVGKTIPYTPQSKFNTGMVFGGSSLLVRHVGSRFTDSQNTVRLPAYTVVDLKWSERLKNFDLELAIDNLFDENYFEAVGNDPTTFAARKYPMPGRRYTLGVNYTL